MHRFGLGVCAWASSYSGLMWASLVAGVRMRRRKRMKAAADSKAFGPSTRKLTDPILNTSPNSSSGYSEQYYDSWLYPISCSNKLVTGQRKSCVIKD